MVDRNLFTAVLNAKAHLSHAEATCPEEDHFGAFMHLLDGGGEAQRVNPESSQRGPPPWRGFLPHLKSRGEANPVQLNCGSFPGPRCCQEGCEPPGLCTPGEALLPGVVLGLRPEGALSLGQVAMQQLRGAQFLPYR